MRAVEPPSIPTWLLKHIAHANEALVGDVLEEYQRGRSVAWYWRQVLTTIAVGRSRALLVTLGLLAGYRIGHGLTIPGANVEALAFIGRQGGNGLFAMYDLVSGGNLSLVTIFALGIIPYVSATLMVQLFALAWWSLGRKTDSPWRRGIVRYTWMAGTLLCIVQATGIALFLERQSKILGGLRLVYSPGWTFRLTTVLTLTAGSAALMRLGDYITERRTGNGLFLMFLAGMLVGLPGIVGAAWWDPYRTMRSLTVLAMIVGVGASGYRRAIQSASLA